MSDVHIHPRVASVNVHPADPEVFVLGAGAVAFVGSWSAAGGFPPNGYRIVISTSILALLAIVGKNTALEPLIKAFAILMLISALYGYIPGLQQRASGHAKDAHKKLKGKVKPHG